MGVSYNRTQYTSIQTTATATTSSWRKWCTTTPIDRPLFTSTTASNNLGARVFANTDYVARAREIHSLKSPSLMTLERGLDHVSPKTGSDDAWDLWNVCGGGGGDSDNVRARPVDATLNHPSATIPPSSTTPNYMRRPHTRCIIWYT